MIGAHALTLDEQAALAEAFSESDLPWRVDVVDWATLDEDFRARVATARLLLLSGSPRSGSR